MKAHPDSGAIGFVEESVRQIVEYLGAKGYLAGGSKA